jgi:hypothetical protein
MWAYHLLLPTALGQLLKTGLGFPLLINRSRKEQEYLAFHDRSAKLVGDTDTSYWEI